MFLSNAIDTMNIELYSIRGFTGSALKQKLEKELESHSMHFPVDEINQVDRFIKAGLVAVPAFKIGDKVIQHPQNGDVEETVRHVMDYILSENMNSILVPVDFSDGSRNAVAYARAIASKMGYGITLVHIHQTLYDPISAGALDVQLLKEVNTRLQELADDLNKEATADGLEIHFNAHMEVGETSSSLIELLDHGKFEMMVIATKSTDNAMRRFFGTVSSEVSRRSHKPVIVVPPQAEAKFPGKLVIGFTEELFKEKVLDEIIAFGCKNSAFFDFIHVSNDQHYFEELKDKLYQRLVVKRDLLCGFNIKCLEGEDVKVHEQIARYANEARAGMIVLVTHQRKFLEALRHESVTKKALHHPELPILIIHQSKD